MYISNILKNFDKSTKAKYLINGELIEECTVEKWLKNGLYNQLILKDEILTIKNNCVIVDLKLDW